MAESPEDARQRREHEEADQNERAVIGSLLIAPEMLSDIAEQVSPHEFVDRQLASVFDVIKSSVSRGRQGHEVVFDVLRSKHLSAAEMAEISQQVIDPGFARWHAAQIREYAQQREENPKSHRVRATRLFDDYLARLRDGDVQRLFELPEPFDGIEIGSGLISCWGAGPGTGKTAAASQLMFGALELQTDLIATIANAEMSFATLAQRELMRRTGIGSAKLREADLSSRDWKKIDEAGEQLRLLLERVQWLREPYNFLQLAMLDDDPPGLLVIDYLQKFVPAGEVRLGVNSVMSQLRSLAGKGWAVLALSATTRTNTKGKSGHSGDSLTLASFKESGEIEFNADSAYLLRDGGPVDELTPWMKEITFDCVKNRHGEMRGRELVFNAAGMRFVRAEESAQSRPASTGNYNFYGDPDDSLEGYEDAR